MAIAFDTFVGYDSAGNESSSTWSHTTSGSDRFLVVFVRRNGTPHDCTGVTYAGVSMTQLGTPLTVGVAGNDTYSAWYLFSPASGANNVVASFSTGTLGTNARSASYTGAPGTALDNAGSQTASGSAVTSISQSITTVADNAWAIALMRNQIGSFTITVGTDRGAGNPIDVADNGPKTPAGSVTVTGTHSSGYNGGYIFSISPTAASVVNSGFFGLM